MGWAARAFYLAIFTLVVACPDHEESHQDQTSQAHESCAVRATVTSQNTTRTNEALID